MGYPAPSPAPSPAPPASLPKDRHVTAEISPALRALLDLMTDSDLWIGKRVEAAKAIIEHEAPTEVFDLTHQFLMGIAEASEEVELKLKALTLIRKVEAR